LEMAAQSSGVASQSMPPHIIGYSIPNNSVILVFIKNPPQIPDTYILQERNIKYKTFI